MSTGQDIVVGFARMDGRRFGIIGNQTAFCGLAGYQLEREGGRFVRSATR